MSPNRTPACSSQFDSGVPLNQDATDTLTLGGGTLTFNASSALSPGTYVIAQQANGSITSSGSPTFSGTAIGSGKTASIQVSGNDVNLVIQNNTTTTLAAVAVPQTYGTASFSATVAPSTVGGTVTFKDGSTSLGTGNLSGGMAVFIPVAGQLTVADRLIPSRPFMGAIRWMRPALHLLPR